MEKEFSVRDKLGVVQFRGELLASRKWDGDDKIRWTDMALYRVIGSQHDFHYALEIVARSYVYHRIDSKCVDKERHRITKVRHVRKNANRWRNLYPCQIPRCRPADLEEMQDDDELAEEKEEVNLRLCADPEDIIIKLYKRNGEISGLAAQLLREAATKDPRIRRAWKTPRRI